MDTAPFAAPGQTGSRGRPLLGGVAVLAAAMGIGRFAYTPILPAMQRAGHLDHAQAGLLAAANSVGYLVGAVLAFGVARPAHRGALLRASVAAIAAATGLMASTTSLPAWAAIRFLAGLAGAGVFVLATGAVLDELRERGEGSRAGWLFSGVGLGICVSGSIVAATKAQLGWRGDWVALALVASLALYPAWRWLPPPSRAPAAGPWAVVTGAGALSGGLGGLALAYGLEGVGYSVTGTFLPSIAERIPGFAGRGAIVWILVGLAAIPSTVLWTSAARRVGHTRALVAALFLQAIGIVLPNAGGPLSAMASAVLFGGTFMGITALTLTLAGSFAPRGSAGVVGTLTAVFGLGQIAGPPLAGSIADYAGGFAPALIAAASVVLVGGAVAATVRSTN